MKATEAQVLKILDDALSGKVSKGVDQDEAESALAALQARAAAVRSEVKSKVGSTIAAPSIGADVLANIQTLAKHIGACQAMLATPAASKKPLTLTEKVLAARKLAGCTLLLLALATPAAAQPSGMYSFQVTNAVPALSTNTAPAQVFPSAYGTEIISVEEYNYAGMSVSFSTPTPASGNVTLKFSASADGGMFYCPRPELSVTVPMSNSSTANSSGGASLDLRGFTQLRLTGIENPTTADITNFTATLFLKCPKYGALQETR